MPRVKVVFFASLKEAMGKSEHHVELDLPLTIAQIKQQLASDLAHGDALLASGIQSSVDFDFTRDTDWVPETALEVAFFPPVTGG